MKEFLDPVSIIAEDEPKSWAEVNAKHAIMEKKRLNSPIKKELIDHTDAPTSWREAKENKANRGFKKAA
jgi:hypothetical protein